MIAASLFAFLYTPNILISPLFCRVSLKPLSHYLMHRFFQQPAYRPPQADGVAIIEFFSKK